MPFPTAPVCSVARSTLATGILAPRGGFQYHRKAELANLPKGVLPWSAILRDAGYFVPITGSWITTLSIIGLNLGMSPATRQLGEIAQTKKPHSFTCNPWGSLTKVRFISSRCRWKKRKPSRQPVRLSSSLSSG